MKFPFPQGGGIYISHNAGLTWSHQIDLPPASFDAIQIDELGRFFVAATYVYHWDDGEKQWIDEGLPIYAAAVLALRRTPNQALYAGGRYGVWVKLLPAVKYTWLPVVRK